jgi:DNA segregation ATPase FtsK/SpoIIIE, S-DNA-T family
MRGKVSGEQIAQIDNPDPFAPAVWRSPVHRTPEPLIWLVQLVRLLGRVVWFVIRHPLLDLAAGLVLLVWLNLNWPGLVGLAASALATLVALRMLRPDWFARFFTVPLRCKWRWWYYRRHWHAVLTVAGLAPAYRGRVVVPVLARVEAGECTDRLFVRLVSGQSPATFADQAEALAHGFRVLLCRVLTTSPGAVVLELVRRDALAEPMTALPIPADPDLKALPVGRREDGSAFTTRLAGTHLLIAGATGAGKGSSCGDWCGPCSRCWRRAWSRCGRAIRS